MEVRATFHSLASALRPSFGPLGTNSLGKRGAGRMSSIDQSTGRIIAVDWTCLIAAMCAGLHIRRSIVVVWRDGHFFGCQRVSLRERSVR